MNTYEIVTIVDGDDEMTNPPDIPRISEENPLRFVVIGKCVLLVPYEYQSSVQAMFPDWTETSTWGFFANYGKLKLAPFSGEEKLPMHCIFMVKSTEEFDDRFFNKIRNWFSVVKTSIKVF